MVKHGSGSLLVIGVICLIACVFAGAAATTPEQVVKITAKQFEYNPKEIIIKKGTPAVLEFTSLDRLHGFNCPGLGVRTDINPKKVAKVLVIPEKVGDFEFHCDNFCGSGHANMTGVIHVVE